MIQSIIEKYQSMPFKYGADCCTFAGECRAAITGENPMDSIIYEGERGAMRLLDAEGGLSRAVHHYLGKPDGIVEEGSTVLADNGHVCLVGVVWNGSVIVRAKGGLTQWPLRYVVEAWSCRKQ